MKISNGKKTVEATRQFRMEPSAGFCTSTNEDLNAHIVCQSYEKPGKLCGRKLSLPPEFRDVGPVSQLCVSTPQGDLTETP